MVSPIRRSTLALTVLATLTEEPMHAYRVQTLIQQRGKDRVVNVRQRASIYQTIDRLLRADLIRVRETTKTGDNPQRTVYEITPLGIETSHQWLRDMLATNGNDFPEFPAAIAHLFIIAPDDARHQLEMRTASLETAIAEIDSALAGTGDLPRLFLLEEEYQREMLQVQLKWVRTLIADLESGRLTWTEEWLRALSAEFHNTSHESR